MTRQAFIRRAGIAAAAVLVAACGTSTATGTPGAAATQAAPTEVPATQAPLPSVGPGFSVTLPSEDKALEDQLPDEVAGVQLNKSSLAGASLAGTPDSNVSKVLSQLGKTPADISAAFGASTVVSVGAYRLKGVDASILLAAFVQVLTGDATPTITDASIGGKAVKKVVTDNQTIYVYAKGDVLFTVGLGTDAAIAEAISKLP